MEDAVAQASHGLRISCFGWVPGTLKKVGWFCVHWVPALNLAARLGSGEEDDEEEVDATEAEEDAVGPADVDLVLQRRFATAARERDGPRHGRGWTVAGWCTRGHQCDTFPVIANIASVMTFSTLDTADRFPVE